MILPDRNSDYEVVIMVNKNWDFIFFNFRPMKGSAREASHHVCTERVQGIVLKDDVQIVRDSCLFDWYCV